MLGFGVGFYGPLVLGLKSGPSVLGYSLFPTLLGLFGSRNPVGRMYPEISGIKFVSWSHKFRVLKSVR